MLVYDCTLRHPARILVFGPSFSGKTTFVKKLLQNQQNVFDLRFDRIIYCSGGSSASTLDKNENVEYYDYFDQTLNETLDKQYNNCLIIDDNMHKAANDINISELFTKKSHHTNTTVIFIIQNLYPKSDYMTDIRRNATYIILMSNPSENKSIRLYSSQIDSEHPKFIADCFINATKNKPFSHLLLDMHQTQSSEVRVRSNILAEYGEKTVCYIKISEYPEVCRRIRSAGEDSQPIATEKDN
jgi:uridine kinase